MSKKALISGLVLALALNTTSFADGNESDPYDPPDETKPIESFVLELVTGGWVTTWVAIL